MDKGSVYRAKYQMKWAGLILLVFPFVSHVIINHEVSKREDYWFMFIVIGIIWTFAFYTYVVERIWKKIRRRHVEIIVMKVIHYHTMCITSLINKDYNKVKFIMNKCLSKHDPSSTISHFILGASIVGLNDEKYLKEMEAELKKIEL